jgi:hypothetical protein
LVLGSRVSARTSRTEITGPLRRENGIMDAVLIELEDDPRPGLAAAPHSTVVGHKPIRLYTGRHHIDGRVTEWTGIVAGGVYLSNTDGDPVAPALMFFTAYGDRGDSGSLVLDTERGQADGVPYLMYLGVIRLGRGREGYGILLDQIARHWQIRTQFRVRQNYESIDDIPGRGSRL